MKKFAQSLKTLRTALNVTQEKLAQDLGTSRSAIGMYETGEREPDFEMAGRIADYFGIEVDVLIGRQPSPETIDHWERTYNADGALAKKVLEFPEELRGAKVAFYDGAFDGLDEDDVDMLKEMARHLRSKKTNEEKK